MLSLVAIIEIFVSGWKNNSWYNVLRNRNGSVGIDFLLMIINLMGIMGGIAIIYTVGGSDIVERLIGDIRVRFSEYALVTGLPALFLFCIAHSFGEYWSHRLFHTRRLWSVHRLHHSATVLNPMVMHRANPANMILNPLFLTLPLTLLSVSPVHMSIFFTVNSIHQLLVHTGQNWSWGWVGKWIIVSPAAHRIHHSKDPEHFGKNLATTMPIWDHLFGTWYDGEKPVECVGVPDAAYRFRSLPTDCAWDVVRIFSMRKEYH